MRVLCSGLASRHWCFEALKVGVIGGDNRERKILEVLAVNERKLSCCRCKVERQVAKW